MKIKKICDTKKKGFETVSKSGKVSITEKYRNSNFIYSRTYKHKFLMKMAMKIPHFLRFHKF